MTFPNRYEFYEGYDGEGEMQMWDDGTYVLYTDWDNLAKSLAAARYALSTFSQYKVASDAMKAISDALNGQYPPCATCGGSLSDHTWSTCQRCRIDADLAEELETLLRDAP